MAPRVIGERSAELGWVARRRSEEHTSELQSQFHLVCRRLLEKKKSFVLRNLPRITGTDELRGHTGANVSLDLAEGNELFFLMIRKPPRSTLFPYPPLFR